MDLWHGSLGEFVCLAESRALTGKLLGSFYSIYGQQPSTSETNSWMNSLQAVANALHDLRPADIGVAVSDCGVDGAGRLGLASGAPAGWGHPDVGVVSEYHLPLSQKRIDLMLCGRGQDQRDRAMILELKQWSKVSLENEFTHNVTVDGQERLHPSEQAASYAEWLTDYHETFVSGGVVAARCAWLHNMKRADADDLVDPRFSELLAKSPLFLADDTSGLAAAVADGIGHGRGADVLGRIVASRFRPSKHVMANLEAVIASRESWKLLGEQRVAYNAIRAEMQRLLKKPGRSVILVRGGPGTGKSVIAVQLLADALRNGLTAAHVTGGKAFTTGLRASFKGADKLFQWNMGMRTAPYQGLDLLVVDEAHRVRATSDNRWTKAAERGKKAQIKELLDAAKIVVLLLDENQFVRPDEIGCTDEFVRAVGDLKIPLRKYDLSTQFRCGGCTEYVNWVDRMLGFAAPDATDWGDRYSFELVDSPEQLDQMMSRCREQGTRARLVAGFCWKWSEVRPDGSLEPDVKIGDWERPWNAKVPKGKAIPNPDKHPYTLWANTEVGESQVGCIYSAQGFEFDSVGVIWGKDLVWRTDRWVAQPKESRDPPVRNAGADMGRGLIATNELKRPATPIRYTPPYDPNTSPHHDPNTSPHHDPNTSHIDGGVMKKKSRQGPVPGIQKTAGGDGPPPDDALFGRVVSLIVSKRRKLDIEFGSQRPSGSVRG